MSSVFGASQSSCFFLRSREQIRLVENKLKGKLFSLRPVLYVIGTKRMLKKASAQKLKIHIQNIPIKQVFQCKTLGVTVDENLCWKSNTDSICKKISSGIHALKRIKEYVDKKTLVSVYNAIIQPYFSYCCEFWNTVVDFASDLHNKSKNYAVFCFSVFFLIYFTPFPNNNNSLYGN